MLPNVRFMAASVVATVAMMLFGFGLFAAFRIANQSSVLQAHTNDAGPPAFADGPVGPPLIIMPPVARTPDVPEESAAAPSPAPEAAVAGTEPSPVAAPTMQTV